MTILYNCRAEGSTFRITKFDDAMNVESSYLTDGKTCDCPAGKRPMCRHREMLPRFQHRGAVGTNEFFDYDRGGWVQMDWEEPETETEPHNQAVKAADFDSASTGSNPVGAAKGWRRF